MDSPEDDALQHNPLADQERQAADASRGRRIAVGGNRIAAIGLGVTIVILAAMIIIAVCTPGPTNLPAKDQPPPLGENPESVVTSLLWNLEHDAIWATPPFMLPGAHATLILNYALIPVLDPLGVSDPPNTPPNLEPVLIPDLVARAYLYDGALISTFGHLQMANITMPVTSLGALWSIQLTSSTGPGRVFALVQDSPNAFNAADCPDLVMVIGYPVLVGNFKLGDGGIQPGVQIIAASTLCLSEAPLDDQ